MDRYWTDMERKGCRSLASLDFGSWFDLWHTHFDWKGRGNRCRENRQAEIKVGYALLKATEALLANAPIKIQTWLAVCPDSLDDAVYIHSENPNGTAFPYGFDNVEWENFEHPLLAAIIDSSTHMVGKLKDGSEFVFFVTRKDIQRC